jgi:YVTN family beta-propeller protein
MANAARLPCSLLVLTLGVLMLLLFSLLSSNSAMAAFAHSPHFGARSSSLGVAPSAGSNHRASQILPTTSPASIPVGPHPEGVAYDNANGHVYVTNDIDNLTVINGSTNAVVRTVIVGLIPWGMAVDSSNGYVYVANSDSGNVTVVNGANDTVIGSIPGESGPQDVAYDPANGYLYVPNWVEPIGNVTIVNSATNTIVGSVPAGADPNALAYDGSNGNVYVANFLSDNATVINAATNTVVGSVPVGSWPRAVAYDGSNGYIYVVDYDSNNVSVIDGTTLVGSISVGTGPYGVAYDSANENVYVTNTLSDNVTVINGATDTVVGSVPVGTSPTGVAYDNKNGQVYVANFDSSNVTVFTPGAPSCLPCYQVTFAESGLTSGTGWGVTLNGSTHTAALNVTFSLENGTYNYTVKPPVGYVAIPESGLVSVTGAAVMLVVTFSAIPHAYAVTFSSTGPIGWSVWINGETLTPVANATTVMIDLTNGSYTFAVSAPSSFAATPPFGTITVAGAPVNVTITLHSTVAVTYPVTFAVSANGATGWTVLIAGKILTPGTGASTVFINLTNGEYTYVVSAPKGYVATPSFGNVTVSGAAPSTITIRLTPVIPQPTSSGNSWNYLGTLAYALIGALTALTLIFLVAAIAFARRKPRMGNPPKPS